VTVIAFDVNETLLDLQALDESFRQVFGDPALRPQWFGQMLQLSFVGGPTGTYVDFTTAQHAALRMLAERTGTSLRDTQAAAIVDRMRTLPPHPEVPAALARLRRTDLSVVAPPTRWRRWPRPNSLTPECAVTSTPSSR
jgi:2-haloacid dehalogenase